MTRKQYVIALLAVVLFFGLLAAGILMAGVDQGESNYGLRLYVMVEGRRYTDGNGSVSQLPEGSVYLGQVTSAVESTELPVEEFQTNHEHLLGAEIYRYEDTIFLEVEGTRWLKLARG